MLFAATVTDNGKTYKESTISIDYRKTNGILVSDALAPNQVPNLGQVTSVINSRLGDGSSANTALMVGGMKTWSGTAAPTIGTYNRGDSEALLRSADRIFNSAPTPGGWSGWICTASGTPGIWKGFGSISL